MLECNREGASVPVLPMMSPVIVLRVVESVCELAHPVLGLQTALRTVFPSGCSVLCGESEMNEGREVFGLAKLFEVVKILREYPIARAGSGESKRMLFDWFGSGGWVFELCHEGKGGKGEQLIAYRGVV